MSAPTVKLVEAPEQQPPGHNVTDRVPGYRFRVDFEDDPDSILVQQVVGSLTVCMEGKEVIEGTWKFFNRAGHLAGDKVDVHELYAIDPRMQGACTMLIERVSMLVGKATLDASPPIADNYGIIGQGVELSGQLGKHPASVDDVTRVPNFKWYGDKQGWTHTYHYEGATGKESIVIAGLEDGMYVFPK